MLSSDFLFPRFFVVPLANPSNFSHCKCFSSRIYTVSQTSAVYKYTEVFCWKLIGYTDLVWAANSKVSLTNRFMKIVQQKVFPAFTQYIITTFTTQPNHA